MALSCHMDMLCQEMHEALVAVCSCLKALCYSKKILSHPGRAVTKTERDVVRE